MRRWVILTLVFFCMVINANAQNKIDEIVEDFSVPGTSTFSSVVERNPKTRKVVKVVKVLQLANISGFPAIKDAFDEEGKNGNLLTQTDRETTTVTITQENKSEIRIYSFSYETRTKRNGVVTIIIKYKKNN